MFLVLRPILNWKLKTERPFEIAKTVGNKRIHFSLSLSLSLFNRFKFYHFPIKNVLSSFLSFSILKTYEEVCFPQKYVELNIWSMFFFFHKVVNNTLREGICFILTWICTVFSQLKFLHSRNHPFAVMEMIYIPDLQNDPDEKKKIIIIITIKNKRIVLLPIRLSWSSLLTFL